MLLQSLKLQLKTCIFPFIGNIILSLVAYFFLARFKTSPLSSISYKDVLIYFTLFFYIVEIIFSFFYGLFNFSTLGKTYSSLRHDKHAFCISSLVMNIINLVLMLIIYFVLNILLYDTINILSLLAYASIHLCAFSFGSFYSLYLSHIKALNIILLVLGFALLIPFGKVMEEVSNIYCDMTLNNLSKLNLISIIILASCLIVTIVLNIINSIKYKKI